MSHYDKQLHSDIVKLNSPTITDKIKPSVLKEKWAEIREIILGGLPTDELLLNKMKIARAATTLEEINVSPELMRGALYYHPYMRYRVLLTRILPMIDLDIMDYVN